jgi:hypothetical protein
MLAHKAQTICEHLPQIMISIMNAAAKKPQASFPVSAGASENLGCWVSSNAEPGSNSISIP